MQCTCNRLVLRLGLRLGLGLELGSGLVLGLGLGYGWVRFAQLAKCAARLIKRAH